jgi:hypothetical protein
MSAAVPRKPFDMRTLARALAEKERDLSRQAREFLERSDAGSNDAWFALVEQAVVQLRRTARELEACSPNGTATNGASKDSLQKADLRTRPERKVADNVLSGHASVAAVSEVLGFLSAMGKSGVLWVDVPTECFLVQLKHGSVVYAQGDNPPKGQRLGEILMGRQTITEEVLRTALERASASHEVLGGYLVRENLISQVQLSSALAEQAQMIFHRMFGNPDATYQFEDGVRMVESQDVRLNVIQLLLESARVNDEGRLQIEAGVPVTLARFI